jgi:hypothetical protein
VSGVVSLFLQFICVRRCRIWLVDISSFADLIFSGI